MTKEELYAHPGWEWCTAEGARRQVLLMGLQTTALEAADLSKELKCFGRVLDPATLASSAADLITAQTASIASQAELQRLKTLIHESRQRLAQLLSLEGTVLELRQLPAVDRLAELGVIVHLVELQQQVRSGGRAGGCTSGSRERAVAGCRSQRRSRGRPGD